MRRVLLLLFLLLPVPVSWYGAGPVSWHGAGLAQARSFPDTSDPTLAAQERWGSFTRGYVTDGCWHADTAAGTTASIASCRAFVLETADPESLQGFEELTPRTITYSAGDGTYWLGGRSNPGLTPSGWTCLAGLHYCTLKADTPPPAANGLVLLGKTTVTAGAISTFTIMAPWRRTTPYTVPAGATLTFGVCPEAGPVPLWLAMNDAGSGKVRFTPWACHHLWAEWWGADPTGLVDATLTWRQALLAGRANAPTPIWCQGEYLLSATEPAQAITLLGAEQIIGKSVLSTPPAAHLVRPCRFTFVGSGRALGTTDDPVTQRSHIYLTNIHIVDRDGTGARGLDMTGVRGGSFHDVMITGFDMGLWLGENYFYGEIRGMRIIDSRTFCADMSGAAFNGVSIEIGCVSQSTTLTAGIRIGGAAGLYGTGHNARLRFVTETKSGRGIDISRQHSVDLTAYVELQGNTADHHVGGALLLSRIRGGVAQVRVQASTPSPVPVGIKLTAVENDPNAYSNVKLAGEVSNFTTPVQIDGAGGTYGVDLSQLAIDITKTSVMENFTTGFRLGDNLITHGPITPAVNQGRGSTVAGTVWKQGDVIWSTLGNHPGTLTNVLRIVNTAGNPPPAGGVSTFILPATSVLTVAAGDTAPSLKSNQIFNTRANLEAGSAITDFVDEQPGMCLWIRALGARTITDGAPIDLVGGNFAMTTNDTLLLCNEGGVWREYARTDYP